MCDESNQKIKSGRVEVALIADRKALLPLAVVVAGVMRHVGQRAVRFHILSPGLDGRDRAGIERLAVREGNGTLAWLDTREAQRMIAELPQVAHVPPISYTRLLLPTLVPDVERLLYLDVDLVVKADIGVLWDLGTDGRAIAAVADPGMPMLGSPNCVHYAVEELEDPDARPFNAGVMLMDLTIWRSENLAAEVLAFLRRWMNCLTWADQDGLNVVLEKRWAERELMWNVPVPLLYGGNPAQLPEVSAFDTRPHFAKPAIYHLAGGNKPWNSGPNHTFRQAWLRELRSSGFHSDVSWQAWRAGDEARALTFTVRNRLRNWRRPARRAEEVP
ncbi:MAG: glycosyltransferase family 8 protein [Planctomycetota bacterium]